MHKVAICCVVVSCAECKTRDPGLLVHQVASNLLPIPHQPSNLPGPTNAYNLCKKKKPFLLFTFILNNLKPPPHFHKSLPPRQGNCPLVTKHLLASLANYASPHNCTQISAPLCRSVVCAGVQRKRGVWGGRVAKGSILEA